MFNKVDTVMAEIQRFYEELNKFWTEEIGHVVEALQKRRIDPKDIERWNAFCSSLRQTIKFWKVCVFASAMHFSTDQRPVFRIRHQAVTLKP